jgi:hypothetical protein
MKSRWLPISVIFSVTVFATFSACTLLDPEPVTVPAYIYVPYVRFNTANDGTQGDSSFQFVDVWMYEHGKLLGNIGFPALIPIQKSGMTELNFDGGIVKSGQDDQRIPYPFTQRYVVYKELTPNKIDTFIPVIKYLDNAKFSFVENFESNGFEFTYSTKNAPGDTIINEPVTDNNNPAIVLGKKSGKVVMNSSSATLEIDSKAYSKEELQPSPGSSVYLEIDYKSNIPIQIGMIAKIGSNNPYGIGGITANPTGADDNGLRKWNKLYLCLDQDISPMSSGTQIAIAIRMLNYSYIVPDVYIDNIKLVHF